MALRSNFLAVGCYRPDQVSAKIFGDFTFSETAERHRQEVWQKFQKRNPGAFDGSLARLHALDATGERIDLKFQRTTFSSYVSSRDPAFVDRFPDASRSDPIGITAVALGIDGYVLVTRRSLEAEQNPGGLYFVGGYANAHDDGPVDLFAEAERELREETGFDEVDRLGSRLLGIAYDPVHCHPEITILLRARASAGEMLKHLNKATDAAEAHSHHVLPLTSVLDGSAASRIGGPATWSFGIGSELLRKTDLAFAGR
ncbi:MULTISPECIES: NUDIX domain-containing protein [unclassified Mesorhizobium]|uniref:NUDIX domain-containing protein n=1 Tax=unclassified Mesorhizobium TaxID=325217 RepID=UPI00112B2FD5|nr:MULTISPECIES: NUDIX domain-containing protein [unclassified Mesorhizobium]TPK85488.1 NUDIX hydrolase [Mesorhizobium sp. B2-4-17]TPK93298.1 NUDIX hydrolase [Mesorhizobium sp. B2-4-14]